MRVFIRKFIIRMRELCRAGAYGTIDPAIGGHVEPIDGEEGSYVDRILTKSGIRLQGNNYNTAALAEMLSRISSSGCAKVRVKITDPCNISSIFVGDSTASPSPCWITVGIAPASRFDGEAWRGLPRHWDDLRANMPDRVARQAGRRIGHWNDLSEGTALTADDSLASIDHAHRQAQSSEGPSLYLFPTANVTRSTQHDD